MFSVSTNSRLACILTRRGFASSKFLEGMSFYTGKEPPYSDHITGVTHSDMSTVDLKFQPKAPKQEEEEEPVDAAQKQAEVIQEIRVLQKQSKSMAKAQHTKDVSKAVQLFEESIREGDLDARVALGNYYFEHKTEIPEETLVGFKHYQVYWRHSLTLFRKQRNWTTQMHGLTWDMY